MWPLPALGFLAGRFERGRAWSETVTGAEAHAATDTAIITPETVTQAEAGTLSESWTKTATTR